MTASPNYDLAVKLASVSEKLSVAVRNRAIYFDQASYEVVAKCGSALTNLGIQFYEETFQDLDMTMEADFSAIATKVRTAKARLYEAAKGNVEELLLA